MADEQDGTTTLNSRIFRMRAVRRGYPCIHLPIFDVDDPLNEGYVLDISERGVQVAGMQMEPHRKKTLVIQADKYWNILPFSFDAECKWCQPEAGDMPCMCGFEIITISPGDLLELQKVIQSLSLLDEPST
jgi:hypothetical protein